MSEGASTSPESVAQFPQIVVEINTMAKVDQDMREKVLSQSDAWDENVDAKNTERMKEVVTQIGWPTASKVGKRASHNAWLLVQHADHNVDFQERCLKLMKQESAGEVALRNIAMLEDRVRVNRNQSQLYGTQFRQDTGEHKPLPIVDEEHVDERREKMGMVTLKEEIQGMYEQYGSPNQG